jgi:hypothetical protein
MEPRYKRDERDGYVYDARIKGADTTFWAEAVGTLAVDTSDSTTVIRVNADRLHSFLQHIYGEYEFSVNIPAAPAATTAQSWGLRNPMNDTTLGDTGIVPSGIYFSIDTDAVFSCRSHDDFGNRQTTNVTWDTDWDGQQTLFKIRWEEDIINFLVNDTIIATHSTRVPTSAQSLELRNATASNMDVSFVRVARAGAII